MRVFFSTCFSVRGLFSVYCSFGLLHLLSSEIFFFFLNEKKIRFLGWTSTRGQNTVGLSARCSDWTFPSPEQCWMMSDWRRRRLVQKLLFRLEESAVADFLLTLATVSSQTNDSKLLFSSKKFNVLCTNAGAQVLLLSLMVVFGLRAQPTCGCMLTAVPARL